MTHRRTRVDDLRMMARASLEEAMQDRHYTDEDYPEIARALAALGGMEEEETTDAEGRHGSSD